MLTNKFQYIKGFTLLIILIFFITILSAIPERTSNAHLIQSEQNTMVVTAHPLASKAALDILHKGGNAVDAAVAAAFAIGVVEPGSSGLGGGGGMLIFLKQQNKFIYINYYQKASENILKINYNSKSENKSAKAVLVPGTTEGLITALEKYGTLPLPEVMEPAIKYAENGFEIDEFLGKSILDNIDLLRKYPSTENIYLREGFPLVAGDTLKQKELSETLKEIARLGRDGFYDGKIAKSISDSINKYGGVVTLRDLKNYKSKITEPVKGSYRGYTIYTAAPPQSGIFVIEALNILEHENLNRLGHYSESAECLHFMAETFKRTYADRTAYLDDPNFNSVPIIGLTSKDYARIRYNDINPKLAIPQRYRDTKEGNPFLYETFSKNKIQVDTEKTVIWSDDDDEGKPTYRDTQEDLFDNWGKLKKTKIKKETTIELSDTTLVEPIDTEQDNHTTHISIIDKDGNAVSLTQTLGTFFGSGLVASGVLLNNSMSNFGYKTSVNAPKPDKQPRSSIAPTILMKNNSPFMVIGSPGAARIIATIVEVIVNVVDFQMDAYKANNAPRFFCQKSDDYLSMESGISSDVRTALIKMGHTLKIFEGYDAFFGGVQLIIMDPITGAKSGSSDPRRGGIAIGD